MTDEEPVLRFLAVVNAGKVYGPYEWNGKYGCVRRPFWMWVAEGDDCLARRGQALALAEHSQV